MKKRHQIATVFMMSAITVAMAYDIVWIKTSSGINNGFKPEEAKAIKYSDDYQSLVITGANDTQVACPAQNIEAMTFDSCESSEITITKSSGVLVVNNPLSMSGVSVEAAGDKITVTANSGSKVTISATDFTSTDGQIKVYGSDKVTLEIKNVNITNKSGSCLNFQTSEGPIIRISGSNTLVDSETYTTPNGEKENGCIFSLKKLTLSGKGNLTVTSNCKHAIASSKKVIVDGASITVNGAASDGLHGDGVEFNSGSYTSSLTVGDAIDGDKGAIIIKDGTINCAIATPDTKGIKADGDITISGGDITLDASGDQCKAIRTKGHMTINDGTINITTSGKAVVVDNDPSYCTAIKVDSTYIQTGGSIKITTSGIGGKGISVDSTAVFKGGNVEIKCTGNGATYTNAQGANEAYSSTCITVDGDLSILGGSFILNNSGTAGKCVKCDGDMILGDENGGPTIEAHTTGNRILESSGSSTGGWGRPGGGFDNQADYSNPKAVKAGGNLTINNGTYTITTSQNGGEGMESKNVFTINGGTIDISAYDDGINATKAIVINGGVTRSFASNNDGIDSNGTITVNGGITIAAGANSPEEGFDCDNNQFKITGGIMVGVGGATSTPTASVCTQRSVIFSATAQSGTLVTITDPNNKQLISFKMPKSLNSPKFLMSSPGITTGTHTIYTGGTVTGGETHFDVTTDGTFSGGTNVTTFSPTSMVTTVGGGGSRPR